MRMVSAFKNRFVGYLWIVIISAAGAWAQVGPACQISGIVRDSSGAPVQGAKVMLVDKAGHVSASQVTSPTGAYAFAKVVCSDWQVKSERTGYRPYAVGNVHLTTGQKAAVDLVLEPLAGAAAGHTTDQNSLNSVEFYQASPLRADEVVGAVDPAGYSSPGDSNTTAMLLGGAAALRQNSAGTLPNPDSQASHGEQDIYDRGAKLLARHDVAGALEIFKTGLAQYPNSTDLQIGLGIALYLSGQYYEAVRSLIQATDIDPKACRPYLFLADISGTSPNESAAVAERLKRFYELYPQDARAVFYFALSRWRQMANAGTNDGWDEIEGLLKNSIALDPKFPDAHLQLGSLYTNQSRFPEAIEQYRQTIALNPSSAAAHYKLGQVLERTGHGKEAEREFKISSSLRGQSEAAQ